ncbi:MAG: DUF86 domain-containing protein [Runella slithyformis]|nr:MAG: DUF86 domain-containing protein [Runella slithyformis]TAF80570.1 MAG: DUF86 domain-containing protein [Runella slithyformis]
MRDERVYLQDIIESIDLIFVYLGDKNEFEFSQSLLLQDAIFRRFEIIGEASANLPAEFQTKYPMVEWRLMKAMRNKLAHEYFGISSDTVYNTIKQDLPVLLEKIKTILNQQ